MSNLSLSPPAGPPCAIGPSTREQLTADAVTDLVAKLKALADPVRLRLISQIAGHTGGEACVCDLSVGIELAQPTISHHLKVLRTAGLLESERRASWVYYRLVPDAMHELAQLFTIDAAVAEAAL